MPRKIASTKNANASRANGRPITEPQRPISPGQKSPSAKDRTVPETAPTANRIPSAFAHRLASAIHVASPRSVRAVLRDQQQERKADPQRREDDVEPEGDRHLDPCGLEGRERQNHPHSMLAERDVFA